MCGAGGGVGGGGGRGCSVHNTPEFPTFARRAWCDLKFMTYFTTAAVLKLQTLVVN